MMQGMVVGTANQGVPGWWTLAWVCESLSPSLHRLAYRKYRYMLHMAFRSWSALLSASPVLQPKARCTNSNAWLTTSALRTLAGISAAKS